jgi:hypothetical protein
MRGTMRRPRLSVLVWAGVFCSWMATAQAGESSGSAVTPTNSFLSARLGGQVSHKTETVKTAVGEIEHHTSSAKQGDAKLSITATVLPAVATNVMSDAMLYRKARGELLSRYDATLVSWKACQHAGYTCRMLKYETEDGYYGMARLYLYEGTLVVLNAIYYEQEDVAKAFLASAS